MNPLDQLLPLIDPQPIPWWPPAPGWWLLALILPLMGWGLWRLARYWRNRPRRAPREQALDSLRLAALDELAQLSKPYDGAAAGPWLQQLNGLLKRLCRQRYPDAGSHVLSNRAWLAFLDSRCPAAGLTRWMVLVEGAYRPHCILSDKAVDELEQAVATWIRKHV
ncbi:DUF4381 domain-containing protein [Pseudomonas sp. NCCP-436]|uniref:DUF4381 domain-containing protein n=1 Tax=Pseudomonas sp. NCCP-436 TaxID=2842481 RepID=UPI001C81CCE8|nr:DUF4381 domain-containing protein [Pseudomonas sp. NCCP-436]GIZ12101.1 hypothetical protein NCCP436_15170 [Pseudomonas sp. NCCP-436]